MKRKIKTQYLFYYFNINKITLVLWNEQNVTLTCVIRKNDLREICRK